MTGTSGLPAASLGGWLPVGAALGGGGAGEGEDGVCLQASGRWSVPGGHMGRMWRRAAWPWGSAGLSPPLPQPALRLPGQSFRCLEGLRRP